MKEHKNRKKTEIFVHTKVSPTLEISHSSPDLKQRVLRKFSVDPLIWWVNPCEKPTIIDLKNEKINT